MTLSLRVVLLLSANKIEVLQRDNRANSPSAADLQRRLTMSCDWVHILFAASANAGPS